jgi:late competence protein required for DNA uptake (superfamily II DNA/RNA helicase)
MGKVIKAKDLKCCDCKTKQAVAFWPCFDPDIPSHPYCRDCLEKRKTDLMIKLYEIDKQHEKKTRR